MGCLFGFFSLIMSLIWMIIRFVLQVIIGAAIVYICFITTNFVFGLDLPVSKEIIIGFSTIIVVMTNLVHIFKN